MKTLIATILLATAIARAETYYEIPETAITPTESHYDDNRLLNLDKPLYRAGEIVKAGDRTCIVWDAEFIRGEWRYTLRTAARK